MYTLITRKIGKAVIIKNAQVMNPSEIYTPNSLQVLRKIKKYIPFGIRRFRANSITGMVPESTEYNISIPLYLRRKNGIPIDEAEGILKDKGMLSEDQDIYSFFENLSNNRSREGKSKLVDYEEIPCSF